MSSNSKSFLLDNHVVLWSLYEPARLSIAVETVLLDVGAALYMSEASLWELLDKAAKGRLPLAGSSPQLIVEQILSLDVSFLPVTQADIVASVSLPLHHGDPFDRMLVVQAQRRGVTLISRDQAMKLYDVPVLWS